MSLKEQIKNDHMQAMKMRDSYKKNILSVIKGLIETVEKNVKVQDLSDAEILKILVKMQKNLSETVKLLEGKPEQVKILTELQIIESYLPKQLTESEIRTHLSLMMRDINNKFGTAITVKDVMSYFKDMQVDKKMVLSIFNEMK